MTTFNEYFVSVASDIGKPDTVPGDMDIQTIVNTHANRPSVRWTQSNVSGTSSFKFFGYFPFFVNMGPCGSKIFKTSPLIVYRYARFTS